MVIGIDLDDTVVNTKEVALENLKKFDSNYNDYHDLPDSKYQEYMKLYQAEGLKRVTLKKGAWEAFKFFKEKGYKIVIITARDNNFSPDILDITLDYLKKYQIPYDNIIFAAEKKGKIAYDLGVQLFIDDKEMVLDDMKNYGIKTIRVTEEKNSKHKTFQNWSDIIDYIKGMS